MYVYPSDEEYDEIDRRFHRSGGSSTVKFDGLIYRRVRSSEGVLFEAVDVAPVTSHPDMDFEEWRYAQ